MKTKTVDGIRVEAHPPGDEPENRCVFHGTSTAFEGFSLSDRPAGGDANGALGHHFTDDPADAADYARTQAMRSNAEGRVVVAKAATCNPAYAMSYFDFFGYDDDGDEIRDRDGFVRLREGLLAAGCDCVDYADGEQAILVVLDDALLEIVAVLTPDEADRIAEIASSEIGKAEDPDERMFAIVETVVAERGNAPGL